MQGGAGRRQPYGGPAKHKEGTGKDHERSPQNQIHAPLPHRQSVLRKIESCRGHQKESLHPPQGNILGELVLRDFGAHEPEGAAFGGGKCITMAKPVPRSKRYELMLEPMRR